MEIFIKYLVHLGHEECTHIREIDEPKGINFDNET
jgi:hypothetical protein